MTKKQKHLLGCRLRQAVAQQPVIRILKELLLDLGGIQLVAPLYPDLAVPLMITTGFVMEGPVHCEGMGGSRCHANVARVWTQKRDGVVGIGTGYALGEDGLWRQHSWGLRREGILETTVPRRKYFGLLLQGADADTFAESNLAEAQHDASQVGSAPTKGRRARTVTALSLQNLLSQLRRATAADQVEVLRWLAQNF